MIGNGGGAAPRTAARVPQKPLCLLLCLGQFQQFQKVITVVPDASAGESVGFQPSLGAVPPQADDVQVEKFTRLFGAQQFRGCRSGAMWVW
jgi:hypothetical protein